jgi:hypothetical protein
MVELMKAMCLDGENALDYVSWSGGFCFFPITLRAHLPSSSYANEPLTGELVVRVKFSAALQHALNCYVFTINSARIGIDQHRNVTVGSFTI